MTGLEKFLKEKAVSPLDAWHEVPAEDLKDLANKKCLVQLSDLLLEFERQAKIASEEMEKNFNTRFRLTHRRYMEYGEILGRRDVCLAWAKAIKKVLGEKNG